MVRSVHPIRPSATYAKSSLWQLWYKSEFESTQMPIPSRGSETLLTPLAEVK